MATVFAEESFIISTCQRLAIFVYSDTVDTLTNFALELGFEIDQESVFYSSSHSAQYLFEVASGIRSLIIGEHEILGQLRKSHAQALAWGIMGPHIDELVRRKKGKVEKTCPSYFSNIDAVIGGGFRAGGLVCTAGD